MGNEKVQHQESKVNVLNKFVSVFMFGWTDGMCDKKFMTANSP